MSGAAKLYLVTRRDLSPGQQAVQAAHALREFAAAYPALDAAWFATSNTLALLAVDDERALWRLLYEANERGMPCAVFREPDLGDAVTALALDARAERLVRHLPLALR